MKGDQFTVKHTNSMLGDRAVVAVAAPILGPIPGKPIWTTTNQAEAEAIANFLNIGSASMLTRCIRAMGASALAIAFGTLDRRTTDNGPPVGPNRRGRHEEDETRDERIVREGTDDFLDAICKASESGE